MVGLSPNTHSLGLANMARSTLNFMSYNSTGLDTVKADWIKDLINTCDIDLLQIQEHFKSTKSVDTFFKKQFSNNDSYVIPAHREAFQDSGRAKGGLAELSAKHLNIKKERIKTKSWRLQAQILHIENYRLMWINCYFPTDPQTIQYNEAELFLVLTEIENILDSSSFDDCILGGDFNFDKRRVSGFVTAVSEFLDRVGVSSVWDKFPVDFTHLHTDSRSSSILDNFFVNQRLLEYVQDAGPVHLGDNRSRHSPIMMKIEIGNMPSQVLQPTLPRPRRPAWYKATVEQKHEYTSMLEEKLADLPIPESLCCDSPCCKVDEHARSHDSHIMDVMCAVLETSHQCIPLSSSKKTSDSKKNNLPGWKENVAPAKKDALFWHSVWMSAARPNRGELYNIMCWTRNKFTYAVRKAKRLAGTIESRKLLEAAESGDVALMSEMKRVLGRKDTGQTVPESLDGKVTHDTILERFKECYED